MKTRKDGRFSEGFQSNFWFDADLNFSGQNFLFCRFGNHVDFVELKNSIIVLVWKGV